MRTPCTCLILFISLAVPSMQDIAQPAAAQPVRRAPGDVARRDSDVPPRARVGASGGGRMNPTVEVVPAPAFAAKATSRTFSARIADFMTLTKPGITVMVGVTTAVGYYVASHGAFDWKLFLHLLGGTLLSSGP